MIILLMMFPASTSIAATKGSVYHIKFNWKIEPNASKFYEMTGYIVESMHKEGVFLYSKYGDFSGSSIYIATPTSYEKLTKTISRSENQYVNLEINHHSTLKTPLHNIFLRQPIDKAKIACKATITKEYGSIDELMAHTTELQRHILRRGHLISITFIGRTENIFDLSFNFLADCVSKEAIMKDLVGITAIDLKESKSY